MFLNTHRAALTALKNLCDSKGTSHNLHKLIWVDIKQPLVRNAILEHFQRESISLNTGHKARPRKILSDVDDTLFSSGGFFPAGVDTAYPRHVLYPGVLAFYRELDFAAVRASSDDLAGVSPAQDVTLDPHHRSLANLVFLSARPRTYQDRSERHQYDTFAVLQRTHGLHSRPTLLAGDLRSGLSLMSGDAEPVALKKLLNFQQYASLYPEYSFVFVGDNGQGDVRLGELLKEAYDCCSHSETAPTANASGTIDIDVQVSHEYRRQVDQKVVVFIHQVQQVSSTPGYWQRADTSADQSIEDAFTFWRSMGICFFTTYIGAAVQAAVMGLLDCGGLVRVAEAATDDFNRLVQASTFKSGM